MFFEGAEKKAEILINDQQLCLLNEVQDSFWQQLVEKCHAKILSSISNEYCKAFLLSESSLFVWSDRFLILTCGETKLVNAVDYFIQTFGSSTIKQLTYQRKNEYFSHAQPSCFGDDVKVLRKQLAGNAYRFGALDSHHTYIFHYHNGANATQEDKTYELLAYQISERASNMLCQANLSKSDIRQLFNLEVLIPGFTLDDFVFDPFGYSLNAISDKQYLTIHVTPQQSSSYVSFESNIDLIKRAPLILDVLAPKSFDLLTFNEFDFDNKVTQSVPTQYLACDKVAHNLANGYQVKFANFVLPSTDYSSPIEVDILGDNHAL